MAGGGTTLEYTPTWVVAVVCAIIVIISLLVERFLHYLGKLLKRKNQKPLFEALQKIKEELMLLGFISLLLTVFQDRINTICMSEESSNKWLPCKKQDANKTTAYFQTFFPSISGGIGRRRLLANSYTSAASTCKEPGHVPILSTTALHDLHIFIFVLAAVHVVFCALTILFGSVKIRQWKKWEDSVANKHDPEDGQGVKLTHEHEFIKRRVRGMGTISNLIGWVMAFFKQFYGSVTKSDYITLRWGFIMTHCRGNPQFNFHKYVVRAFEADFKKVVGISWYLWIFVVVFLLVNVDGWHSYYWIAYVPLVLLLAVGTKLEHVITQLAHEVAEKHAAVVGDVVVKPSDEHFWFNKPKIVLYLIHVILFQNSLEMTFFFFIWAKYKFDSCMMGPIGYVIPRLVIGVFIQFVCSYSTLPLYALVTQMGSSYKKAIFDEHIQEGLVGWAKEARKNIGLRKPATDSTDVGHKGESHESVQMAKVGTSTSPDGNKVVEIAEDSIH